MPTETLAAMAAPACPAPATSGGAANRDGSSVGGAGSDALLDPVPEAHAQTGDCATWEVDEVGLDYATANGLQPGWEPFAVWAASTSAFVVVRRCAP